MKTSHHPNLYPIARRFCAAAGLKPLPAPPVVPAFPRVVAADLDEDDFEDTDLEDDDDEDEDDDSWLEDEDEDEDFDDDDDDDIDDCLSHLYTDHGCPVG